MSEREKTANMPVALENSALYPYLGQVQSIRASVVNVENPDYKWADELESIIVLISLQIKEDLKLEGGEVFDHELRPVWDNMIDRLTNTAQHIYNIEDFTRLISAFSRDCGPLAFLIDNDLSSMSRPYAEERKRVLANLPKTTEGLIFQVAFVEP